MSVQKKLKREIKEKKLKYVILRVLDFQKNMYNQGDQSLSTGFPKKKKRDE